MSNAEIDRLIDAFLVGELDEPGRIRLAVLLESDRDARREFDDAMRLEALISAAHVDAAAERRAMDKLVFRLNAEKPARVIRPTVIPRSEAVKRSVRPQLAVSLPKHTPISAWTALAASILILFGLAFYFIYDPAPHADKPVAKKDESKKDEIKKELIKKEEVPQGLYSVASGSAMVDGKEARNVGENEKLVIPASGPTRLNANDGTNVLLEAGSIAYLRKRGATLSRGAGRFGVSAGDEPFVLHTPLGTVNSASGVFEAHLENVAAPNDPNAPGTQALTVTLTAGTVQVESFGKTTQLSQIGATRRFVEQQPVIGKPVEKPVEKPVTSNDEPKLRPPEMLAVETILEHDKELNLTADQKNQFNDMLAKITASTAIVVKDAKVKELFAKQKESEKTNDDIGARHYRGLMRQRADEILGPDADLGNPMDVLNEKQRRIIDPFVRDLLHDGHPPHPPFPPPIHERDGKRPPPF